MSDGKFTGFNWPFCGSISTAEEIDPVRQTGPTTSCFILTLKTPWYYTIFSQEFYGRNGLASGKERKGKEEYIIVPFWPRQYAESAQAWIAHYLQITPCLPFLHMRSPDGTTTVTAAADIQLQLTAHLSTPKRCFALLVLHLLKWVCFYVGPSFVSEEFSFVIMN